MTDTSSVPPQREPTPFKLHRSFRNRILYYLLFLSFPPLMIWGIFAFWGASDLITGFLENEIQYKTTEVAAKIELAKTINRTFVSYVALELKNHRRQEWQDLVVNVTRAEPALYNVHALTADGDNIVRSDGLKHLNYRDRLYFRNASEDSVAHEMVMARAYPGHVAICSGRKIKGSTDVTGVCRFVDDMVENIREVVVGRTGYVFIVDNENQILVHPRLSFHDQNIPDVERQAIEQATAGTKNSRLSFAVADQQYIGSVHWMSDGWKLIAVHPRNELFVWAAQIIAGPTAVGILVILLVAVLVYFAVDRATQPLRRLTLAARRLSPNNMQVHVPVESQDEMGLLAQAFNDMAERLRFAFARLQEKETELQRNKNELEHQVMEQSQKLLYSTKMTSLGEMAGGIAHEVNNPLAIISLRTQKLKEKIENGDVEPTFILETIEKIEKTCMRINQIIRGLRAFSRDGSQDPMVLENLSSIVWESVGLCSEALRSCGIELEVICDESIEIRCQPVQIGQVLLNLLTNAKDAVRDLPERWIRIEARKISGSIEVIVTDSGTGLTDAVKEKVMQPFFTTKKVGEGTGLGLSISKGIVQQHHGDLFLSRESVHTQFIVRLPE